MDWIERWFDLSPDGGDGTFELLLTLLAVTAVLAGVLAFNRRVRARLLRWVAAIIPGVLGRP